jgi:hypothetical protein
MILDFNEYLNESFSDNRILNFLNEMNSEYREKFYGKGIVPIEVDNLYTLLLDKEYKKLTSITKELKSFLISLRRNLLMIIKSSNDDDIIDFVEEYDSIIKQKVFNISDLYPIEFFYCDIDKLIEVAVLKKYITLYASIMNRVLLSKMNIHKYEMFKNSIISSYIDFYYFDNIDNFEVIIFNIISKYRRRLGKENYYDFINELKNNNFSFPNEIGMQLCPQMIEAYEKSKFYKMLTNRFGFRDMTPDNIREIGNLCLVDENDMKFEFVLCGVVLKYANSSVECYGKNFVSKLNLPENRQYFIYINITSYEHNYMTADEVYDDFLFKYLKIEKFLNNNHDIILKYEDELNVGIDANDFTRIEDFCIFVDDLFKFAYKNNLISKFNITSNSIAKCLSGDSEQLYYFLL